MIGARGVEAIPLKSRYENMGIFGTLSYAPCDSFIFVSAADERAVSTMLMCL